MQPIEIVKMPVPRQPWSGDIVAMPPPGSPPVPPPPPPPPFSPGVRAGNTWEVDR